VRRTRTDGAAVATAAVIVSVGYLGFVVLLMVVGVLANPHPCQLPASTTG